MPPTIEVFAKGQQIKPNPGTDYRFTVGRLAIMDPQNRPGNKPFIVFPIRNARPGDELITQVINIPTQLNFDGVTVLVRYKQTG